MSFRENINNLKQPDIYSFLLFVLYQLTGVNEYSSLSELVYVLDKKNFLNLCEFFGGQTITIPTVEEIENLTYAFLVYQYVNMEGLSFKEALDKIPSNDKNTSNIRSTYKAMCEALKDYSFDRGENA